MCIFIIILQQWNHTEIWYFSYDSHQRKMIRLSYKVNTLAVDGMAGSVGNLSKI